MTPIPYLKGWHAKTIIASLLQHNPKLLDLKGHWVKASLSPILSGLKILDCSFKNNFAQLCSSYRQGWGSQIEDGRALWNQTTQNCKSFQLICLVVELLCLVDSKFYTDLKNSSVPWFYFDIKLAKGSIAKVDISFLGSMIKSQTVAQLGYIQYNYSEV